MLEILNKPVFFCIMLIICVLCDIRIEMFYNIMFARLPFAAFEKMWKILFVKIKSHTEL